ncbi:hypothetical protein HY407_01205 [Candidatus Gottesmanbacteria bacterium]|nr:hypothetical protein [Candidatus Gottesmanbacteria bacterium]
MKDLLYQKLVERMTEVAIVAPQRVGPLTVLYKRITPHVKKRPWKALFITSSFASFFIYLLLGSLVVKLASLLQFGF